LSEALLEAERSFIGPAGTFVVFDGSRGIHRGGQVEPGGSRWVIQIALRVSEDKPAPLNFLQKAKWKAGYWKYLATGFWETMGGPSKKAKVP
jgi:hypothetical protein